MIRPFSQPKNAETAMPIRMATPSGTCGQISICELEWPVMKAHVTTAPRHASEPMERSRRPAASVKVMGMPMTIMMADWRTTLMILPGRKNVLFAGVGAKARIR